MDFSPILRLHSSKRIKQEQSKGIACFSSQNKAKQNIFPIKEDLEILGVENFEEVSETIYSMVIPFREKRGYLFLALRGLHSAFQLTIERNEENKKPMPIFLYRDGLPHSSSFLRNRLELELACLEAGSYFLELDELVIFRFEIRG